MSKRARLKRHIADAWWLTVEDYDRMQISNEAGLQVNFASHLRAVFQAVDGLNRTVFVQPTFRLINHLDASSDHIPDVAICSDRRIIGLIELKYAPRGAPEFKPDLRKLCRLFSARADDEMYLKVERYRGPVISRTFHFSSDVLLAYCAVYSDARTEWRRNVEEEVTNGCGVATQSIQIYGAPTRAQGVAEPWAWPTPLYQSSEPRVGCVRPTARP